MYTLYQMVFFFGIFVVMNIKAISIAFPFMTFLCIPSRLFFLPKIFANWEMTLLDGDEDQIALWVQRKQDSIRGVAMSGAKNDPTGPGSDVASVEPPKIEMDNISEEMDV
jgi:hypothetical protein